MALTTERKGFIALELFKMVAKKEYEDSDVMTAQEVIETINDIEENHKLLPKETGITIEELLEIFVSLLPDSNVAVFKKAADEYLKSI
jgi:hypothetical protein